MQFNPITTQRDNAADLPSFFQRTISLIILCSWINHTFFGAVTRMEGLPRLQASRRGYRAHVTKTFGRITEITQSTEPVTSAQMISLRTTLEQLQLKKVTLEEIDTKIINAM